MISFRVITRRFFLRSPQWLELKVGARMWIARIMITWGLFSGYTTGELPTRPFDATRFLTPCERFAEFYGAGHIIDQTLHPGMHETHTIDIICLLQGEASLILESGETRLRPGNVVIQRGTNHAWKAHGSPALFLAVLIDREVRHE